MDELDLNMVVYSLKLRNGYSAFIEVQSEYGKLKKIGEEGDGCLVLMMKHELAPAKLVPHAQ